MKRLFLTLLAVVTLFTAVAGGISTAAELVAFAEAANAGGDLTPWQNGNGEVCLTADIDLGKVKRFARIENFEGVFDGGGHVIQNWKADGGLFRLVAEGSVVRNVVIAASCSMKVSDDGDEPFFAGFVADVNHGVLERCENYGSISHRSSRSQHDNYVGGVCGMNKYIVIRCKNGGEITSTGNCPSLAPTAEPRMYLGGVLGGSFGRSLPGAFVAYCENTGRVSYSGAFIVSHIGGIVGYNMRVKTKFCINRGEIVSAARGVEEGSDRYCQEMAGGICGMAKGDVMCCDNFGAVTTRGHAYSLTAGICGSAHESLTVGDCDNFAPVTSTSSYQAAVGGIVGLSGRPVVVAHCRNKGAVRFDGTSVDRRSCAAGIVGDIYAKKDAVYAASVRYCRNEGDISCGLGENTRNSARGIQAAGIVGFINGNEKVSADIRDCVNTGKVRSESGRTAGICGFASYCDFDGNENLGTVEGAGALLGGIVAAFERGTLTNCTNRGDVLAEAKGEAGGIAATTWTGGNAGIEGCRNSGVVKGLFGLTASILGEGRSESDRIGACGVGGAVGTVTQSRAAVPKVTPENFGQFITGRNVAKNNATVDEASCYYWDGNN